MKGKMGESKLENLGGWNPQKRGLARMMRRILMVPLLVLALAGFAKSQAVNEKEEDAEVIKKEILETQKQIDRAFDTRDRAALDLLFADDFIFTSERFGRGELFNKAQFVDFRTGEKKPIILIRRNHDVVDLHVFGDTVVLTGHSKTILHYKGLVSTGPRLFTFVYIKRNGRWQAATWFIADIPYGDEPWNNW